MRDPARIPIILEAIKKAWERSPDLRLGQLIVNATPAGKDGFFIEDDMLLQGLANIGPSLPGTIRPTKEDYGYMSESLASGEPSTKESRNEAPDEWKDMPT